MGINLLKSKSILPLEYQQVEYLESTGEQWIDTGLKGNQNSSVDLSLEILQFTSTNNGAFFGARNTNVLNGFMLLLGKAGDTYFNRLFSGYGNETFNTNQLLSLNTRYDLSKQKGKLIQRRFSRIDEFAFQFSV